VLPEDLEVPAEQEDSTDVAPEPPAIEESRWSVAALVTLTIITVLAGALRLYKLGEWSYWIDEVHMLRDSVVISPKVFWEQSGTSQYPLGFMLLRWLEPLLPGTGEGSYRLVFAFFGICSIPLLGVIVRGMFNTGTALIAALVLALCPWHIYWSQNCRFYSLVLFLSLASLGLFYRGIQRGSGASMIGGLVFAVLASFTHPSAVFVVPSMLVFLGLLKLGVVPWPPHLTRRAVLWFVGPVVLASLLLPVLFQGGNLWLTFKIFMSNKSSFSLVHLINTTVYFLRVPLIVAAMGGFWLAIRQRSMPGLFFATFLVVSTLGIAIPAIFVTTSAQYLFFTLPAWIVLAAWACWEVGRYAVQSRASILQFLALAVLLSDSVADAHLYYHHRYGDRPRWREAADFILDHQRGDDRIASTNVPCLEWYLNPHPKLTRIQRNGTSTVEGIAGWSLRGQPEKNRAPILPAMVADANETGKRIFVVLTEPEFREMDVGGRWLAWLRERFHLVKRLRNWNGPKDMDVYIYRYTPPD